MIEIYAFAEPRDSFWELLAETEEWLREPGWSHDAGRFFNKVAGLADLPHLERERGEIRDRCRLGLANKLRQHANTEFTGGTIVVDLFGAQRRWSPAVVSDAEFALRATQKQRPKFQRQTPRPVILSSLYNGTVTAAAQAPDSGELFVGFRDGAVVRFDPNSGEVRVVVHRDIGAAGQVVGLATDEAGKWVAIARADLQPVAEVISLTVAHRLGANFRIQATTHLQFPGETFSGLLPLIIPMSGESAVGVSTTARVSWYVQETLVARLENAPTSPLPPTTYLKLRIPDPPSSTYNTFSFRGGSVSWGGKKAYIGWMPDLAEGSTLYTPAVAWNVESHNRVQLAGLFDKGHLYSSAITRNADGSIANRTHVFSVPNGFRAVAFLRSGRLAGVSAQNRVLWLRESGPRLEEMAPSTDVVNPAKAVASFPSRQTDELLVVFDDGTFARAPTPS